MSGTRAVPLSRPFPFQLYIVGSLLHVFFSPLRHYVFPLASLCFCHPFSFSFPLFPPSPTPPIFSQAASSPLPSLTSTPLPPSRQGSIGPVRTQGRGLRVDNPELPPLSQVEWPGAARFEFSGKNFFLTWSQIGDRPNSNLEDHMAGFGSQLECE